MGPMGSVSKALNWYLGTWDPGWIVLRGQTPAFPPGVAGTAPLIFRSNCQSNVHVNFASILVDFWSNLAPQTLPKSIQNRSKSHQKSIPTCILTLIGF